MPSRAIATDKAALAVGPYSQAVVHDDVVYVSGCVGLLPGPAPTMIEGGLLAETEQAFNNLEAILAASGSNLQNAIRCTVYITNMADFPKINGIYSERFGKHRPARACVGVKELPKGALFEIDCIASVGTPAASPLNSPSTIGAFGILLAAGCFLLSQSHALSKQ